MTLQQLRYVTAVADARTISKAAQKFYISQPSLTNSIHELEQELGLTILSPHQPGRRADPGGGCLSGVCTAGAGAGGAHRGKISGHCPVRHQFCVSAQHYSFAVEAFVQLLKEYGGEEYDFPHPGDPDLRDHRGCCPSPQRGRHPLPEPRQRDHSAQGHPGA